MGLGSLHSAQKRIRVRIAFHYRHSESNLIVAAVSYINIQRVEKSAKKGRRIFTGAMIVFASICLLFISNSFFKCENFDFGQINTRIGVDEIWGSTRQRKEQQQQQPKWIKGGKNKKMCI